jgi:nucleoid DNA-binding protein
MTPSEDVQSYIAGVASPTRRRDAQTMVDLMARVTGEQAAMWGTSIVGFGTYHYRYESGREGDAPAAGFSPRKAALTVYLADGVGAHAELLERLGVHSVGVGCLYIKDLERVDLGVLETIVAKSYGTVTAGTHEHRAAESSGG